MRTKGSKNKKGIKVKEEVVAKEELIVKVEIPEVKQPRIGRLTSDFGREDLNQLRDKVNEIINFIDPLN